VIDEKRGVIETGDCFSGSMMNDRLADHLDGMRDLPCIEQHRLDLFRAFPISRSGVKEIRAKVIDRDLWDVSKGEENEGTRE